MNAIDVEAPGTKHQGSAEHERWKRPKISSLPATKILSRSAEPLPITLSKGSTFYHRGNYKTASTRSNAAGAERLILQIL